MLSFFIWYILATLLGWLTFPLAYHLFPALKDRGYTLSRALGLLIWAYAFWLFASFGIAQNDIGGLLLGLLVLVGASGWIFFNLQSPISGLDTSHDASTSPPTNGGSAPARAGLLDHHNYELPILQSSTPPAY